MAFIIPQPVVATQSRVSFGELLTGRVLAGSGTVPTSGIGSGSGTLSGPWMIEVQNLDFNYWRTPEGVQLASNLTLSSSDPVQIFQNTYLECRVRANYQKKKTYGWYSTSSWVQPQTFIINAASADGSGLTYAPSGGIHPSAMGPLGVVLTEKSWYYRRPWIESIDTVTTCSIDDAWTLAFAASTTWVNANYLRGDYLRSYIHTSLKGTHLADYEAQVVWGYEPNSLPGGFSVDQETAFTTIATIDNIGTHVTNADLVISRPNSQPPTPGIADKVGFSQYDITRHDYT